MTRKSVVSYDVDAPLHRRRSELQGGLTELMYEMKIAKFTDDSIICVLEQIANDVEAGDFIV